MTRRVHVTVLVFGALALLLCVAVVEGRVSARLRRDVALEPLQASASSDDAVLLDQQSLAVASVGVPGTPDHLMARCLAIGVGCTLHHLRLAWAALQTDGKNKPDGTNGAGDMLWREAKLRQARGEQPAKDLWKPSQAETEAYLNTLVAQVAVGGVIQKEGTKPDGKTEGANRWSYTMAADGTITQATGFVRDGPGTNAAKVFNELHFRFAHSGLVAYPATINTINQDPYNIESGHIIAGSLGGSNGDILNFFPQTGLSNRGPYKLAEDFARWLRTKVGHGCNRDASVRVTVVLNPPGGAAWPLTSVPTAGTYTVTWDNACIRGGEAAQKTLTCQWTNTYSARPGGVIPPAVFDPVPIRAGCASADWTATQYITNYPVPGEVNWALPALPVPVVVPVAPRLQRSSSAGALKPVVRPPIKRTNSFGK